MSPRLAGCLLLLSMTCHADPSDKGQDERMDPVVPTNLIPPSPVLPVAEALKSFRLAPGFVIEPVAAEPLVQEPVCLDFDAAGRMWICEMTGYMPDIDGKGESSPQGRIVILEDTDSDGKADKRTVFLDKLMLPRALCVFEKGLLYMEENRLSWVARNGDAPAGEPKVIDTKFAASGNVEHKPNGILPNLDNRYYLAKSDKRLRRHGDAWEMEPTAFRGQWGIARDDCGRLYHNNNSTLLFGDFLAPNLLDGNPGVKMKPRDATQLGTNLVWPARVTPAVNRAYVSKSNGYGSNTLDPKTYKLLGTTAAAGMTIYRGTNFPGEWYGTAFTAESVANLVKATRITRGDDGSMTGAHPLGKEEFLASTDERFRPVNVYNSPDASLYLLDMYHGIIQHKTYMTPYLRQQTLGRSLEKPGSGNGRIYRIRSLAGKIEPLRNISALQGLDLVKILMHPNAWQREMAQRLLVERNDPATVPWLAKLADAGPPVARIHAIWTLEGMGALGAIHLVSAIRGTDADLQSSALWASTRLAPAELARLGPVIASAKPVTPAVTPYLARALGPVGTPAAYAALAELIGKQGKTGLVREAAISGLDHHEQAFRDAQMKSSKDARFLAWLDQGSHDATAGTTAGGGLTGADLASYRRGKTLFQGEAACFGCHGADGAGMPNLGPPLDESQWVIGNSDTLVKILLHGLTGPVTVAGDTYNPAADMPGLATNPAISDQSLADISTYIRNEWSNKATAVPPATVAKQRDLTKTRGARPWTAAELGN